MYKLNPWIEPLIILLIIAGMGTYIFFNARELIELKKQAEIQEEVIINECDNLCTDDGYFNCLESCYNWKSKHGN